MYYEVISCRWAIQVCTGYSSNGRARTRTFSMKGIRPDASDEAIAVILRALAPLLVYPIVKVRKVTKRTIFFNDNAAPATPAIALPTPIPAPVEPEIIPAEPDILAELFEPVVPEISVWEDWEEERAREEQEKFALALCVYMLWGWTLSRQGAWAGYGLSRAPPMQTHGSSPHVSNVQPVHSSVWFSRVQSLEYRGQTEYH